MLIICYYSNKANHNYSKLLDKFEDLELVNTRTVQKVTIDFSNSQYTVLYKRRYVFHCIQFVQNQYQDISLSYVTYHYIFCNTNANKWSGI